ncbi:ComEA family DNA-binding protein [Vibrio nigripulchritudo]|uniref:Putative Competence protein ComEA n=1 Tax=Vibrio nigripulchritudo TaxID=28173 RepID=U4KDA9_9VIBR|nr:ComEA family DNA-binding protein [Vibrio nigripulchritudo]CCN48337.1 putative Competence protein ComEA [Vibrio nigripulchritudo MADA3020]CCN52105.1 putative Competence protein ComEA [Vibrio nigripulchritudo MADA3021]CCN73056.1 putative Competence protein ComEA [Vibrio nigripulchritudo SFn118]CCN84917.1 putative Competence protein ComEA [Vibrio nigripulchritudo BLFn1]CCN90129.1 putative Competence protein ComEA [Vibrio nigripulchritudo SFn27]
MKIIKLALIAALSLCSAVSANAWESNSPSKAASSSDKHAGIEITVNINTATAEELQTLLIGIGAKKAKTIVEFREKNGLFQSADDLSKVKGIGNATVDKNRDRILL